MSPSHGLVLACFVAVLNGPTALRLERGSISSGELAQRTQQAVPLECPWGKVQARGTATVEDESAAQEVCAPEVSDWQSEFAGFKNWSDALREAPLSASDIREQSMLGEAVRTLKQKSRQPHIAFIGDSLMRQQYFNLASWMIHGEARPSEPNHYIVADNYQKLWRAIFRHQNRELQGEGVSEICHCGRDNRDANKHDFGDFVEDRFITLPQNGSSITYINWSGEHAFHGYFNPSDERPTQAACEIGKCTSPFKWTVKQPDWQNAQGVVQLLRSVVAKLNPTPTHVMLNTGKWGHLTSRGLRTLFAAGAEIQQSMGTRFVWKTVTHSNGDRKHDSQAVVNAEKVLAMQFGWDVFDAYNMTSSYPGRAQNYRDDMHFEDKVTTHLNRMYVESLLQTLQ
mmetsp:Transcript_76676/g.199845  ORF Transcript_76676/g.199845 Transcript_76676/m.199845 type:complete len:397 (-) Transcript_76676:253-1443(-)